MSEAVHLVVPCFNESERLDTGAFLAALDEAPRLSLVFVDDGSTDETSSKLEALVGARPGRTRVVSLGANAGKGEAVRKGLLAAFAAGATLAGYLDADLATSIAETLRLAEVLQDRDVDVVLGTRVSMLGRDIERSRLRHYLGRLFASAASLTLGLAVYDTQCGAKVFRRTSVLDAALSEPFLSRWVFDVEVLGRLLAGTPSVPGLAIQRIIEEPLAAWHDVAGSKISPGQMAEASVDLVRIAVDLSRRRAQVGARR